MLSTHLSTPCRLALCTGLLTLCMSQTALAQQSAPDSKGFAWQGEELYYSIRVGGAEALRAGIRVGDLRRRKDERLYVPISAKARTVGAFKKIYPLHDWANTFVNPHTLRPLSAVKSFDERGRKRSYHADYLHGTFQAQVTKRYHSRHEPKKERQRKFVRAIPGTTHDMVSWLYELRSAKQLALHQRYTFYIYDGWKLSRVEAKVEGKDDVMTPLGWFKGWRLSFTREILRSSARHDVHGGQRIMRQPQLRTRTPAKSAGVLWVSRDENLIPLKFQLTTRIGTGEAVLIKYVPSRSAQAKIDGRRRGPRTATR